MPIEMIQWDEGLAARVQAGPGEKVLWLHGYTINGSTWQPLWDLLPDWYHIGLDLPGHGASGPWPEDVTLPKLARRIGRLAIEEGVQHIVALSFGTMLGLQVVLEYPEAFASLTLGAPALAGGPTDPQSGVRYGQLAQLFWQRGPGPWMTELWMQSPPDIFAGAQRHPLLWESLIDVLNEHNWSELKTGRMRGLVMGYEQTADSLRQITTSTLVLVGDEEMKAFRETADILGCEIPNCQRINLPQTGHLCMLEGPQQCAPIMAAHWQAERSLVISIQ
jgi:2-succinyl-6-hydroxy-2,4-cyclohexadiene-1-carboxylate synthase